MTTQTIHTPNNTTRLNIVSSMPIGKPSTCRAPELVLTADQLPLWVNRAAWVERLNQATRELAAIDKALALPRYEGKAQTVIVKAYVLKGRRKTLAQVGEIVASFVNAYAVPAFWRNTKRPTV